MDEFDSKKVKFSRTVNAVDELVSKITSIPFYLNYFELEEILEDQLLNTILKRNAKGRFYLNEGGIDVIKNAQNLNHKIYFSSDFIKIIIYS